MSEFLSRLEHTSSRNAITAILAELFEEADADEAGVISYLALGELVPPYRGLEFQIAEKMLIKILATAYGVPQEAIAKRYKEVGDLGDVAYDYARRSSRRSTLSVRDVYERLMAVAREAGEGSQERKIKAMAALIRQLDPMSAKFVTRIPAGKLRLGFSDLTLLDALSVSLVGDKSARPVIERAYNVTADIGEIVTRAKRAGLRALARLEAKPGIPIRPSLAERIPDPEEIIRKLGPTVAIEPKLDGFRTQIHMWRDAGGKTNVALFSRNLENTTLMFPEIVESARKLGGTSAILDGETIGYDPATKRFTAFQETVQRKRRHGIEAMAKKIPLATFVFDILYRDGRSLLEEPFAKRRQTLESLLPHPIGAIHLVTQTLASDAASITRELRRSVEAGLEGVVIKNLSSPYEAGSRGFHWVKFKPGTAALEKIRHGLKGGLPDTIDCVLMGAYKGRGKRAEFGVGGFLLGVAANDGKFYTITRLGSGLSDKDFREMRRRIKPLTTHTMPPEYVVEEETVPDIWVRPSLVLEILADEITLSPRHTAGRKKDRGYSLRFPRLVRFRDDKSPEDATRVSEIERMYRLQRGRATF